MSKFMPIRKIRGIACVLTILTLLNGTAALGADVGKKEWRFSKAIDMQTGSRYNAVFLDEEVYAGASEPLSDLRILNSKRETWAKV